MRFVVVAGRRVGVTEHAVDRYLERVLSGSLDRPAAFEQLSRVALAAGEVRRDSPAWLSPFALNADGTASLGEAAEGWLMIGEDVALALVQNRAITCVVRGGLSEASREKRSEKQRLKRQRRRTRRMAALSPDKGRRSVAGPPAWEEAA